MIIIIVVVVVLLLLGVGIYVMSSSKSTETATGAESGTTGLPKKTIDVNTSAAVVLGDVGINPWGACPKFKDRTAKWIWSSIKAEEGAGANIAIKLQKIFNSTVAQTGKIYGMVDDNSIVYINGTKVGEINGGWGDGDIPVLNLPLTAGENLLEIIATNRGGPAGFIAAIYDAAETSPPLSHTDSSWIWKLT